MANRQKRNSVIVHDSDSEDSTPPAQVNQAEATHDTDSEVSEPLAQVRRVLDTPTVSPLSAQPTRPTPAPRNSITTQTALNPLSEDDEASTIKLILDNLGGGPEPAVQVKGEEVDSPLSSVKSVSPPPDFSPATRIGPGTHPLLVAANTSPPNASIALPPPSELTDLPSRIDMDSNMHGRRAEFQAESARQKAELREAINSEENLVHEKAANMERTTESAIAVNQSLNGVQNEDGSTGKVETQHVQEAIPKEEAVPKGPTIADVILEEVRKANRKTFTKGDAAIILDTSDLTSTLLISYRELTSAAPEFCKNEFDIHHDASIRFVVLLKEPGRRDQRGMPILSTIKPNLTENEFIREHRKHHTRAQAAAEEAKLNGNVKNEEREDDSAEQPEDNLPTDWKKAYEIVFAILTRAQPARIFRMLGNSEYPPLPLVEGIVAIADQYKLLKLQELKSAFSLLLLPFIDNKSLWTTIAKKPVNWSMIGLKMRNDIVYKEAFKHLCGSYPACEDDMKLAGVPEDILALVERKSRDLRNRRLAVDQELLTLDLDGSSKFENKQNSAVYQTLALFRHYMCNQIKLLTKHEAENQAKCKHNPAGFYHAIRTGDDAYLAADDVVENWKLPKLLDEWDIREILKLLKSNASELALLLTRSTLQY